MTFPPSHSIGRTHLGWWKSALPAVCIGTGMCCTASAQTETGPANQPPAPADTQPARPIYIREYRVVGSKELPPIEVQEAVYPYLGPGRTAEDVEAARAALEKAYHAKGFQAAAVQVPLQQGRGGIVVLEVTEGKVGRLRVKGSRYFLPSHIKEQARSLAEGRAVNFNNVTREVVALNTLPDRQVTPALRAGLEPGTVDIDLTVKDKLPLHGSLELNNRYSADTTELRLSGSATYDNLWQLGHSLGGSFQISPQDRDEVKVFSGYYIARFPSIDWLSVMVQGTKQDSNVSTLGAVAVAGRGEILGARAIVTLPPLDGLFHSVTLGFDYKNFEQNVQIGLLTDRTPITYYPFSATYGATLAGKNRTTELSAGVTLGLRGAGSDQQEFERNRFGADTNFIHVRGELSHEQTLPRGFQVFGKVHGQIADQPLVNSEQFAGGGLGTARGYLEAEALGDNALFGTLELRSPSLLGWLRGKGHEWRVYAFADAGLLDIHEALPEQENEFRLASIGAGSRIQLLDHLNGSIDLGLPILDQGRTSAGDLLLTFRVWADF